MIEGAPEPTVATDCNLSGSRIQKAQLCGAVIDDADMSGATNLSLAGTTLDIEGCTMTGMRIDGIDVDTLLAHYRKNI